MRVGAVPRCTSSDVRKCHSFQLQQVMYQGSIPCTLPVNGQGEIEFRVIGRRPIGSSEEDCKYMLIAGKGDKLRTDIEFALSAASPVFQPGFIELSDSIDPSMQNSPITQKFLIKYVGTAQTTITIHCKFWHGNSLDVCDMCAHFVTIVLSLG